MPKLEPPPEEVQGIFEKPGREWTPGERSRVYMWLFEEFEKHRLRYLLTFALRNLGNGATFRDAEDAWGNFCVDRLEAVISHYDPARTEKPNNFWGYLKLSFARYCWDKGKQIQKKRQRVVSLDEAREGEEGELPQLELVDPRPSPADRAIRTNFLESLNSCLQELKNPLHRQVFILRDIEGLSEQTTAEVLGVPPGSVKVWLRRARLHLRDCLQAKGWEMP